MVITFEKESEGLVQPFLDGSPHGHVVTVPTKETRIDQRGVVVARIIRDNLENLQGEEINISWFVKGLDLTDRSHDIAKRILSYNLEVMEVPKEKLHNINIISSYE